MNRERKKKEVLEYGLKVLRIYPGGKPSDTKLEFNRMHASDEK